MATQIVQTSVTGSKPDFDVSSGAYETVDLNKELTVTLQNLGEENIPDFALFKYNEDKATTLETNQKTINKNINESVAVSESFETRNEFQRSFEHTADAEDVFSKEWVASRSFEESGYFLADYFEYNYTKHTPGAIDVAYLNPNKVVNENLILTSIVAKDIELVLTDNLVFSESFSRQIVYNISLLDQTSNIESSLFSQGFGRALPIGYFSSDYVDPLYYAEQVGYDRVLVSDVITPVLNG